MAENKNVRRLQNLTRAGLEVDLKTKMLGLANDANPSLGFKTSAGGMIWFNSEGGAALYESVMVTDGAGVGNRSVGFDENGNLIEYAPAIELGWDVVENSEDFTALDYTIHLVDTSSADINATIPDAAGTGFQTRIYKTTDIKTPDVIITTPSSQEIGGSTEQLIQGASEGFFAVAHGDHYDIVQNNRGDIQRKLSQSTTIVSGYGITINGGDPTKIDVASGVFAEEVAGVTPIPPATSDLSVPVSMSIKTDAIPAVAIDGIATDGYTIFQIDVNGDIIQTLNGTPSQESENVSPKIAVIVHAGGAILSAESWWTVGQNPSKRVSWLLEKLGILKEGVTVFGAGAGNLQFAHDAGVLSYAGADGDKAPNNPDEQPVPSQDPVAGFILAKQDAFVNFAQTAIDPTQIDVNGTLTTITGNDKVSIQRIMINRNGSFTVQYGQNVYATLQNGLTALAEGTDTFTRFNVMTKVSRICAYLIIDRTCTDLTNTALAQFVQTGLLESDAGLSSTSELVTLLKAIQNGNSAGDLQIVDLADATTPQGALTKAQLDATTIGDILGNGSDANGEDITGLGDVGISKDAGGVYLNHPSTDSASAVIFQENGVDKIYIQHIGTTFSDPTRQNALELNSLLGDISLLASNGVVTINTDVDMGSNKLTAVADGTVATDGVNLGQVDSIVDRTTGSFTATLTGVTTTVTETAVWQKIGDFVTISIPRITGVSNSIVCAIEGVPEAIRPSAFQSCSILVMSNTTAEEVTHPAEASVYPDGTIQLSVFDGTSINLGGFLNNGFEKGLWQATTITYSTGV